MKSIYLTLLALMSIFLNAQTDSISKPKKNFSIFFGHYSFSPLRMDFNKSFDLIPTRESDNEYGIAFEKEFKKNNRFFMTYRASLINSSSVFRIGFDSNRFYPYFNSDTILNSKYSTYGTIIQERNILLSAQIGYKFIDKAKYSISLSTGLTGIRNITKHTAIWGYNSPQVNYSDFIVFFSQGDNVFMGMFYGSLSNLKFNRHLGKFDFGINITNHFSFSNFVKRERNVIYFLSNTEFETESRFYQNFNYYGISFQLGYSF